MIKQRYVAALLAEFIGTLTLALVVLSVISSTRYPFFAAVAAGVTLAVFVSAFGKVSGGHLNPAVTLGMFAIRQISALKAAGYIVVQVLAGFAAWQLYEALTGGDLTNSTTAFDWPIAAAEFIGAFIFGTAIAAVVTQKIQGYQAAYTIGGGLFLGLTVAGLASNAILNPAVAVAFRSLDVNYLAGPVLGIVVSMAVVSYVIVPIFKLFPGKKAETVVSKSAVSGTASVPSVTKKPAVKKPAAKKAAVKKTSPKAKSTKK
jgi:glycerol uptake facilitator-like aquaporin